jgi:hypothetical protein
VPPQEAPQAAAGGKRKRDKSAAAAVPEPAQAAPAEAEDAPPRTQKKHKADRGDRARDGGAH